MKKSLFAIWVLLYLALGVLNAQNRCILPEALQKGDLIAIVFPASYIEDEDLEGQLNPEKLLEVKVEWLKNQGYRAILYPKKIKRLGYLAGTDDERAKAFMDAWKNEEVKAVWCCCGGYGSGRILDKLDYGYIKAHPKIFIGTSDITILHDAIQTKTGLITFLSPGLLYYSSNSEKFDDQYAFSSLEHLIVEKKTGVISVPPQEALQTIRPGIAQGRLVGGNLTLMAMSCGTEWQPDMRKKILILEEVSANFDEIDRSLWQLKESGVLDQLRGVILGTFTNCKPYSTSELSLTLDQIFDDYFKDAPYPVIKNFPAGHDKYQVALPLNGLIEIDANAKQIKILEPSVK